MAVSTLNASSTFVCEFIHSSLYITLTIYYCYIIINCLDYYNPESISLTIFCTSICVVIFSVVGICGLRQTSIRTYSKLRFVSLSKQHEMALNMRMLLKLGYTFRLIGPLTLSTALLLIASYWTFEIGSYGSRFLFQLYLINVSLLLMCLSLVSLQYEDSFIEFKK